MNDPGITVVVVSRGMVPLLQTCLRHVAAALEVERDTKADRLVVVDNASEQPYEPTAFPVPGAVFIRLDVHHSFSACCNLAMRKYPNALYLMLNNDVLVHEKALAAMLRTIQDGPRIGVCGTRLVYPDGTIQHCGIRFGPTDLGPYHVHRHEASEQVPRAAEEFQAVTGACMLLRQEVIGDTGGFDETYPFGWEDLDLCLRARQQGWRIRCCSEADSIHFESKTPGRKELEPPSKAVFMRRWEGKWSVDG